MNKKHYNQKKEKQIVNDEYHYGKDYLKKNQSKTQCDKGKDCSIDDSLDTLNEFSKEFDVENKREKRKKEY